MSESGEIAVHADPDDAGAWRQLGLAAAESGRVGEAVQAFQRAMLLRPTDLDNLVDLANASFALGRVDEAVELLRRAVDLSSDSPPLLANLLEVLTAAGRTEAALEVASRPRGYRECHRRDGRGNQGTGAVAWDTLLPSSPYGAATVTNGVVFTTTFKGDLYALDAATGAILFKTPLSAGSNAPVAVDGDYVIAGAAFSSKERDMIIAYKLGATGKLPDTVGS